MSGIKKGPYLNAFYWGCQFILWSYMSVTIFNLYRSWYFAAAIVLVLAGLCIAIGILRARGLMRSLGLILIYYSYLLLTSAWAEHPDITIWYVATESIFIVIFVLFFLLARNFPLRRTINLFFYLVIPAGIVFLAEFLINPEAPRIGGYALVILPAATMACAFRLLETPSITNLMLVGGSVLMLAAGMSRAPLLSAGIGMVLLLFFVAKGKKAKRRYVLAVLILIFITTSVILAVPPLRMNVAKNIVRLTNRGIYVGERYIEPDSVDSIRWGVFSDASSLYKTHWLFGIGYMNFMPWYGEVSNFWYENARGKEMIGMNLHNVFQTWGLEGGVPCLLIVFLILAKYFAILFRLARRSTDEYAKSVYRLLTIEMICLLIFGLFHQIHQQPVFFMLLGIVYGLDNGSQNPVQRKRRPSYVRHLRTSHI